MVHEWSYNCIWQEGHSAFFGTYNNPCTALAKIIAKLCSPLDNGTKYMPPSNLEFTKIMLIIYQKM